MRRHSREAGTGCEKIASNVLRWELFMEEEYQESLGCAIIF